ncbi:MAG TPA: sigma-70 family RNA polymerase sigma factor [Gemmataceae bacterium]|jgi:RNA polymerase sigma factor (sigma-70 family)
MAGQPVPPLLRFIRAIGPAADPEATDGQLLARFVRQREEEAFAALLRRHGPMVWGVCRRILADADTAEDAFQATFLVLLRKAGSIRRPDRLANFLYGVAYRTAAKANALRARRQVHEGQSLVEVSVTDDDPGWRELRPLLDEELQRLPEKYRAPLVLCYLEGKTYVETARALGWAEGTVSGRLARARDLLRSRLLRRGLVLSAGSLAVCWPRVAPAAVPDLVSAATFKAAAGAASPTAAALSKGVLHAMFLSKVKITASALLAVALIGTGAGATTHHYRAAGPSNSPTLAVSSPEAETLAPQGKEKEDARKDKAPSATSPDGKLIAMGKAKTISLIDAASQKEVRRMASHTDNITALAFAPDGSRLVSGGADKTIQMWDVATGKLLWKFQGESAITRVEFSKDGRQVMVQERAGKNRKLDAATGKTIE